MSTQFGRGQVNPDDALVAQLPGWLRGFDPGDAPIRLRLRVSADLRTEAERRPASWRPWLRRGLSFAAASVVALVGAALVMFLVGSGAGSAVGSPAGPAAGQNLGPSTDARTAGGLSLQWLAVLLVIAGVAGAATNLGPIRRLAWVIVGPGEGVQPATGLPRRVSATPRLAIVLALLGIIEVVWSCYLYPRFDSQAILSEANFAIPLALAPTIVLRYSVGDRSGRWLLIGAVCLAMANVPGLALSTAGQFGWLDSSDWGPRLSTMQPYLMYTLTGLGWLGFAIGVAGRSGLHRRPPGLLVALAIAAILCGYVNWALSISSQTAGDSVELNARLAWQLVSAGMTDVAWLVILWTGLVRVWNGGADRAWKMGLVPGAILASMLPYSLAATAGGVPVVDFQVLLGLDCTALAALLIAVLMGLNPVRTMPEQDVEVEGPLS